MRMESSIALQDASTIGLETKSGCTALPIRRICLDLKISRKPR